MYRQQHAVPVTHLGDSPVAERSWHTVHTNVGPTLLGVWYRAPDAPQEHTDTFETELQELLDDHVHTLVVGDLNVYHQKWLKFSPSNTPLGQQLQVAPGSADLRLPEGPLAAEYLVVTRKASPIKVPDVIPPCAEHRFDRLRTVQ